ITLRHLHSFPTRRSSDLLDLEGRVPELTLYGQGSETVEIALTGFDALGGTAEVRTRGVPVRRVGEQLVTTVFDLLLAQYGVFRRSEEHTSELQSRFDLVC